LIDARLLRIIMQEGKQKQPYFVYREGKEALQMAGLYDIWRGAGEEPMFSFTILTTNTSEKLAW
jgi:putative SOS response-associated peptidase YedK